jgi:hypothetical protein
MILHVILNTLIHQTLVVIKASNKKNQFLTETKYSQKAKSFTDQNNDQQVN